MNPFQMAIDKQPIAASTSFTFINDLATVAVIPLPMLRITPSTSSQRARSYYSTADYYTQGQELTGVWRGQAALLLGLSGTIDQRDWDHLCDNLDPRSGDRLTARTSANRRVGYDFNFHVPKSLSVLHAFTQDVRLLDAFNQSVEETMCDIERDMKTRVRKDGRNDGDRTTGNMVWGQFVHTTSRPVSVPSSPIDGVPDPHLHAHCFVFNATFDAKEQRWKAGQFGDLKRDGRYYEALFHSRLASNLRGLGLEITRTKNAWELTGLDAKTLQSFSRRTQQIDQIAEAQGITDPTAKAELGARTRQRKAKQLSLPQLQRRWDTMLDESQRMQIDTLGSRIGTTPLPEVEGSDQVAVDHALTHCFERRSVVPDRAVMGEALRRGVGTTSETSITDALARRDRSRPEPVAESDFPSAGRGGGVSFASPDRQGVCAWQSSGDKPANHA
jgi:conjugative relaxase-like TrwC/TraI family protein